MNYRMIVTIVPRGSGEKIAAAAVSGGAGGGTVLMGKGSAASSVLQFLGLGETDKDIALSVAAEDKAQSVMAAVSAATAGCRPHFGIMFSLWVGALMKSGPASDIDKGDIAMDNEGDYRMVNVIVNRGYAEDAMAAARKAGATGGTILQARGTAREGDAEFFGVRLVPEKDMLVIVVEASRRDAVLEAIRALPCFAEKGSGIVFSQPVSDFTPLGR